MFAIVFDKWDINILTSDWQDAIWFCGRLNETCAFKGRADGSPMYQIYWVD
jgi:hypothetical protein